MQWIACPKCRMDVVEVETEESRATDVDDLTRSERLQVQATQSACLQSGPNGAKPPVQVH